MISSCKAFTSDLRWRKIQEAYLAMQLETRYTKDQILESYLNTIYLGENYYGVYTAAQVQDLLTVDDHSEKLPPLQAHVFPVLPGHGRHR